MTMTRTSKALSSMSTQTQSRSWRRTVADALALAQSAVELDLKNTDPMGALVAYTESVRRLRSILARLERHGAHAEASQLATITAGYSERMGLLCVACAVPPPPYDYPPPPPLSESNDCSLSPRTALPPPPAYDARRREPTRASKTVLQP